MRFSDIRALQAALKLQVVGVSNENLIDGARDGHVEQPALCLDFIGA